MPKDKHAAVRRTQTAPYASAARKPEHPLAREPGVEQDPARGAALANSAPQQRGREQHERERPPRAKLPERFRGPLALSYSRRTDGVADKDKLLDFLNGLRSGTFVPLHPWYGYECKPLKVDAVSFPVITWLSKDYRNLLALWDSYPELAMRRHLFAFTINGPDHSLLEPGLNAPLEERFEQLARLADIVRGLGQDPDESILVHLDPIVLYRVRGAETNNLGHVAALGEAMRRLGLTRLHMSFMQFGFSTVKPRVARCARAGLEMYDPDAAEKKRIIDVIVAPALGPSIRLQSCTYDGVPQGACFGSDQVRAAAAACGRAFPPGPGPRPSGPRVCACYPFRDVGKKKNACPHGCVYCFVNPREYEICIPGGGVGVGGAAANLEW